MYIKIYSNIRACDECRHVAQKSLKPNGDFTQRGDETCIANHSKRVGFNSSVLLWVFHNFWSPNIQLSFSALNHVIETQDLLGPKKKVRLRSHGFSSRLTLLQ